MSANSRRKACMRIIGRMQNEERGELIAEILNTYGLPDEVQEGIVNNIGSVEWAELSSWVEDVVAREDSEQYGPAPAKMSLLEAASREEDDTAHDCHSVAYNGQTCAHCGNRSCCAAHPNICYECWSRGKQMPG